ncbi:hypothetical protein BMS3Abin15_01152 [bacterium BMS3Abin15]|nr:hypothetical protein BMS3Abin15_01152 [bacterium BMS3Abin15]
MGVSEGCTLKKDIHKDTLITYDDVQLPKRRMRDGLRDEHALHFFKGSI